MDLAKIRKKALLEQHNRYPVAIPLKDNRALLPAKPVQSDTGLQEIIDPPQDTSCFENNPTEPDQPLFNDTAYSALEVILNGRQQAGYTDDNQSATDEDISPFEDDFSDYLYVNVSGEFYGIDIMQIKEIIKPRPVTEIPRTPPFVSGVLSLRGVMVPVLYLSRRLGLEQISSPHERNVIVKNSSDESFTGLVVDQVIGVSHIRNDSVESAPMVLEAPLRNFISGIGRENEKMFIILDLPAVVNFRELL